MLIIVLGRIFFNKVSPQKHLSNTNFKIVTFPLFFDLCKEN
jgi:hypothetical protein